MNSSRNFQKIEQKTEAPFKGAFVAAASLRLADPGPGRRPFLFFNRYQDHKAWPDRAMQVGQILITRRPDDKGDLLPAKSRWAFKRLTGAKGEVRKDEKHDP